MSIVQPNSLFKNAVFSCGSGALLFAIVHSLFCTVSLIFAERTTERTTTDSGALLPPSDGGGGGISGMIVLYQSLFRQSGSTQTMQ